MRRPLWQAMAMLAALGFGAAQAQMYKCKGPDGKIVYSDTKCEASATGDTLKVTPMGTTKSERERAMEEAAAQKSDADRKAAAAAADRKALAKEVAEEMRSQGGGAASAPAAPYKVTSSDLERIRELEMQAGSSGASPEQKRAAQIQVARIKRGADARMSASERHERDALMTDLSSTDKQKRARAIRELESKYY